MPRNGSSSADSTGPPACLANREVFSKLQTLGPARGLVTRAKLLYSGTGRDQHNYGTTRSGHPGHGCRCRSIQASEVGLRRQRAARGARHLRLYQSHGPEPTASTALHGGAGTRGHRDAPRHARRRTHDRHGAGQHGRAGDLTRAGRHRRCALSGGRLREDRRSAVPDRPAPVSGGARAGARPAREGSSPAAERREQREAPIASLFEQHLSSSENLDAAIATTGQRPRDDRGRSGRR